MWCWKETRLWVVSTQCNTHKCLYVSYYMAGCLLERPHILQVILYKLSLWNSFHISYRIFPMLYVVILYSMFFMRSLMRNSCLKLVPKRMVVLSLKKKKEPRGRVEVGKGGGFSWGGGEGWGEKAYNCNWITIKIKKKESINIVNYVTAKSYFCIFTAIT